VLLLLPLLLLLLQQWSAELQHRIEQQLQNPMSLQRQSTTQTPRWGSITPASWRD
jgi:hypothetical protein